MADAAFSRRDFAGGAVATTITGSINASDTSISIGSATGWPSGTNGEFFVVINEGNSTEEKVRIDTRSTTTLTVTTSGRGVDGTTAAAHSSGESIRVCLTAFDLDEANKAVNETVGQVTAAGQLLVADAANSLAAVDFKTSGRIPVGNGTTLASVAVSGDATLSPAGALTIANDAVENAMIADDAVDSAQIAAGAIDLAHMSANSVDSDQYVDGSIDGAHIANDAIDSQHYADGSIDTAHIGDLQVTTDKIAAGAVTTAKFASGTRPTFVVANVAAREALSASEGDLAYVTGTNLLYAYDGTEWDPIQFATATPEAIDFTPTWEYGSTAVTVGNGVAEAKGIYVPDGAGAGWVNLNIALQVGSTTNRNAGTGDLTVGLIDGASPTWAVSGGASLSTHRVVIGSGIARDDSGSALYLFDCISEGVGTDFVCRLKYVNPHTTVTHSAPFTPGTADHYQITLSYHGAKQV